MSFSRRKKTQGSRSKFLNEALANVETDNQYLTFQKQVKVAIQRKSTLRGLLKKAHLKALRGSGEESCRGEDIGTIEFLTTASENIESAEN